MADPKHMVLRGRSTYPDWFVQLVWRADQDGVWDLVDPDGPDAPVFDTSPPKAPLTIDQLRQKRDQEQSKRYRTRIEAWERELEASRGPKPVHPELSSFDDVKQEHSALIQDYNVASNIHKERGAQYRSFSQWLAKTVDPEIWTNTIAGLQIKGKLAVRLIQTGPPLLDDARQLSHTAPAIRENSSLQDIIRSLKTQFASSETSTITTVRDEYRQVLLQATKGGTNPERWYAQWLAAYQRGKLYGIPEVQGTSAIQDFLTAVSQKMSTKWGIDQLGLFIQNDELGLANLTLEQYGQVFSRLAHIHQGTRGARNPGIFATLGERSDGSADGQSTSGSSSGKDRQLHACPCRFNQKHKHSWPPSDCAQLQFALTGTSTRELKKQPTEETVAMIKKNLLLPKWKGVRADLEQKYKGEARYHWWSG
jgi:hypothetical protein